MLTWSQEYGWWINWRTSERHTCVSRTSWKLPFDKKRNCQRREHFSHFLSSCQDKNFLFRWVLGVELRAGLVFQHECNGEDRSTAAEPWEAHGNHWKPWHILLIESGWHELLPFGVYFGVFFLWVWFCKYTKNDAMFWRHQEHVYFFFQSCVIDFLKRLGMSWLCVVWFIDSKKSQGKCLPEPGACWCDSMVLKDPLYLGGVRVTKAGWVMVSLRFGGKAKEPPMHRRSEAAGLERF